MAQVESSRAKINIGEKKPSGDRSKHSNYFLTFNLNRSYTRDDPNLQADAKKLAAAVNYITGREQLLSFIKVDPESAKSSMRVVAESAIELGERRGYLHAHVLLLIHHRAKVRVDFAAMRAELSSRLGEPIRYFNYKLFHSAKDNLQDYLEKNRAE